MNNTECGRGRVFAALAGAMALASVLSAAPAHAAVLTFDGDICGGACGDFGLIDKNYGDIAGVVDVQYLNLVGNPGLDQLRFWRTDYNDLVNVAWTDGNDSISRAEIFIKPLNGDVVTLNSFDLGAFSHTQRSTTISILDGDNNVLSFTPSGVLIGAGDVHTHFDINLSSASGIRIQWGPSAYNVGIDNIDFSVGAPVPLPAPAWMLGGGLVALMARRRRA